MVFQIKIIKAQKMNLKQVRLEVLNALRKEGRTVENEFKKTVATWSGEKPKFESLVGLERPPGSASVLTGPTGSNKALNKFKWLDEGTATRWALMSGDWRSKTKVGRLKSGSGSGRVVIAGRRAMQARGIAPRKGIEKRGWTPLIQKRRRKPFTRGMVKAMQKGASKIY